MKQILTIFGFTLRSGIRKRSFRISTLIMLLLIAVLCLIPFLQNLRRSGGSEGNGPEAVTAEDYMNAEAQAVTRIGTCYYIDEQNQIPEGIAALKRELPGYTFIQGSMGNLELYKSKAADDGSVSVIIVTPPGNGAQAPVPHVTIINRDILNGMEETTIREDIYSLSGLLGAFESSINGAFPSAILSGL